MVWIDLICNFSNWRNYHCQLHHRKYCKYAFRNILGFLFNRLYCTRCLHCFCILSCFCDSGNGKEKRIAAAANRYANGSLSWSWKAVSKFYDDHTWCKAACKCFRGIDTDWKSDRSKTVWKIVISTAGQTAPIISLQQSTAICYPKSWVAESRTERHSIKLEYFIW